MKMLKRLFQFSRKRLEIGKESLGKPQNAPPLLSALDPEEFARLLASGRLEDLKILAQRLSGTTKVKT
ncbi:MAG TPA: hypothetical protein VHY35_18585 [Stellaceae bacterium]|jgi:hypothetical protein|nr:hypothetical protein [Stellaceae bacterium]